MHEIQLAGSSEEQQKQMDQHNPRNLIMGGLGAIALFFGLFMLWAAFTPLHSAVMGEGNVIFDTRRKTIQHLEGGIVKEVLVKEGENVKAGQPLIILADDQTRPIVKMMEEQSITESAAMARLDAEKNGRTSIAFPSSVTRRAKEPEVARIIQTETRLFHAKLDAYNSQVEIIRSQIQQVKESIKGLQEQLVAKKQEISTVSEQLTANRTLLKDGYVTRTTVLDLERMHAKLVGEKSAQIADLGSNRQRLAEYEARLIGLKNSRIQDAANEMKSSAAKKLELEERMRPAKNVLDRQVIKSPVDGRVVDLKVTTVGGVISGKEPLMDIVPQGEHLVLETKIGVNDINEVKVGQSAQVTLTAYNPNKTPTVKARVIYVSADRLTDRTVQGEIPHYSVRLEMDQDSMKQAGDLKLYPGMSAQVSIMTRPRTAFDYFIGPLKIRIRKAFHEK